MPFSNPIVGGTALVRPAINSPDFRTGVQGWSINADGSAEFNNAAIRGEVDVGPASPSPRLVITKNIPAGLSGASADFTWDVVKLIYQNATDFYFESSGIFHVSNQPVYATGVFTQANGVRFFSFNLDAGVITLYGSNVYNNTILTYTYRQATVNIGDGSQPAGSANAILFLNQDGSLRAVSGSVIEVFSGAGLIVDPGANFLAGTLVYSPNGLTPEIWHDVATGVGFQHGWSNLGLPFVQTQYRLVPSPANSVQIVGSMVIGTKVDGTVIFNLPAGYRPAHEFVIPVTANASISTGRPPSIIVLPNGDVQCAGVNAAAITDFEVNVLIPLDA